MRMLDLFSGIGGFALAAEWTWADELDIVGFCEIEKYAQKVLQKNFPGVPIHEDITKLNGKDFKNIDIITGGFPCQDISIAGKGEGIEGSRSGLWTEMCRIISEVRPRYAIIENVPMLIHRGLERVLCDLTEIGYDCEWQIIGADEVGAWHRRKRIWIIAYSNNTRNRTQEHRANRQGKKKAQESQFKIYESWVKSSRHSKDVSDTNNSRHMDRQIKEQPTEGRLDALSKSESGGTYERNVSDTDSKQRCGWNTKRKDAEDVRELRRSAVTGYWNAEPDVGRVAHGVSNRVDRLKGLGNGIVPQVAYEIMKRINI
mgnify:CR=1 FL=1